MSAKGYPFSRNFQVKILALMVQHPTFVAEHLDVLNPAYFQEDDWHPLLARLVLNYAASSSAPPTKEVLENMTLAYAMDAKLNDADKRDLLSSVYDLYEIEVEHDEGYLRQEVVSFGQYQALVTGLMDAVSMLDRGETREDIQRVMERAFNAGTGWSHGLDVFDNLAALPDLLLSTTYSTANKVSTPIQVINDCTHGGIGPGELGVISGRSGIGKSGILANIAVQAAKIYKALGIQKSVLIFTNELSDKDYLFRIGACLSGVRMFDLIDDAERYRQRIGSTLQQGRLNITIQHYPPNTATVNTLKGFIYRKAAKTGSPPGLIVVDDPDHFLPSTYSGPDLYQKHGYVYKEILALLDHYQCSGWLSSQISRWSYDDETGYGTEDTSNSMQKVHLADIFIKLRQHKLEEEKGFLRMFLSKVRRGVDNQLAVCKFDKERMLLRDPSSSELQIYTDTVWKAVEASATRKKNPNRPQM